MQWKLVRYYHRATPTFGFRMQTARRDDFIEAIRRTIGEDPLVESESSEPFSVGPVRWAHGSRLGAYNGVRTGAGPWPPDYSCRFATCPHWFVAGAAALLPAARAWRWSCRRRHRLQNLALAGCCPTCRYDLRATPGRCPECGGTAETTSPAADGE